MISVVKNEHMFELKYRPPSIKECILPKEDKELFTAIVESGKIPHMVLQSNSPGTGKTTVARALCNDVDADMLFVNGSDCKIDFVRNELTRFASSRSIEGKQRVIVIDEFDRAGLAESQRHLRSFMETYGHNCSIIITANNLEGIIEPLRSRSRVVIFGSPTREDQVNMMKDMIIRIEQICDNENIKVENRKVLAALVKKNFPDFRKTVNDLQKYSIKGVVDEGILSQVLNTRGSIDDVLDALKAKDCVALRALCGKYAPDYSNFIVKFTDEVVKNVKSKTNKFRAYEIIGENNQLFGMAANVEIHLMYMFAQLVLEMDWV